MLTLGWCCQAVGIEPLYRVPGIRVMPSLIPKAPTRMDNMRGGGGVGGMLPRGAGPIMRPPLGAGNLGGGMGPMGHHGMPGASHVGMGGPHAMGYHGGPGQLSPGPMYGPGHHAGGLGGLDPHGQGAPAPSPFAARHQQLASPGGGSDYGGYGSRGGSDVGASPGPRLGSEQAHTPGRGPQSEQVRSDSNSSETLWFTLLLHDFATQRHLERDGPDSLLHAFATVFSCLGSYLMWHTCGCRGSGWTPQYAAQVAVRQLCGSSSSSNSSSSSSSSRCHRMVGRSVRRRRRSAAPADTCLVGPPTEPSPAAGLQPTAAACPVRRRQATRASTRHPPRL